VHLVTGGHFRSRDEDGGHANRSAVGVNPMLYANPMTIFYRTGVMLDRSLQKLKNKPKKVQ